MSDERPAELPPEIIAQLAESKDMEPVELDIEAMAAERGIDLTVYDGGY